MKTSAEKVCWSGSAHVCTWSVNWDSPNAKIYSFKAMHVWFLGSSQWDNRSSSSMLVGNRPVLAVVSYSYSCISLQTLVTWKVLQRFITLLVLARNRAWSLHNLLLQLFTIGANALSQCKYNRRFNFVDEKCIPSVVFFFSQGKLWVTSGGLFPTSFSSSSVHGLAASRMRWLFLDIAAPPCKVSLWGHHATIAPLSSGSRQVLTLWC